MNKMMIAVLLGLVAPAMAQEEEDAATKILRLQAELAAKQKLIDQQGTALQAAIKERQAAARKQAQQSGQQPASAPQAPATPPPMVAQPMQRYMHMDQMDIEKGGTPDGSPLPFAIIWGDQSIPLDGYAPMVPLAGINGKCPATWVMYNGRLQCMHVGGGTPGLLPGNSQHFGFRIPETPGSVTLRVVGFAQHDPREPPHAVCTWPAWYGPRGSNRTVMWTPRSDCPGAFGYR